MGARKVLRFVSLIMLIVAVIFVFCALSCPTLGQVFYIGNIEIGPEIWRAFYAVYAIVMVALFGISFFLNDKR